MDHNSNTAKIQRARATMIRLREKHGPFSGRLSVARMCDDVWALMFAEVLGAYETIYDYLPKLVNKNWQMKPDDKYVRYIRFTADESVVRLEHQTKKGDMVFLRMDRKEKICRWHTRPSPDWINQPRDSRRPMFDPANALGHLLYILANVKLLVDIAEMDDGDIQAYEEQPVLEIYRGEGSEQLAQDSWFKF